MKLEFTAWATPCHRKIYRRGVFRRCRPLRVRRILVSPVEPLPFVRQVLVWAPAIQRARGVERRDPSVYSQPRKSL
jgi:hypothetical protein